MANLAQFRENVTISRKRQDDPATGRPYTLGALAKSIGLSADELGHRLRGTGRSKLTSENVLAIVRTLAEWETLAWDEAVALLVCMDYPLDQPGWQTELQRFLGSPPQSVHQTIASRVASPGEEEPSLPVHRRPFQACDLPREYVPRPNLLSELKRLLLTQEDHQTTAITTALRGAGGFGKTTLASALCHDPEIQEAFPDGILWKELGEHPPEPLTILNELLHVLDPSERESVTLKEARERWQSVLEGRSYLLVIDDVWQTEALKELLQGGSRCGRLITTRNDQILPDAATRVWVDAMEPAEAMALLCEGGIDDWQHTLDPSVLEEVVTRQLGCWPLLVSLARGMLTNQVRRLHKAPKQALALLKHAYDERGMATFHLGDREERQRNVDACLEVNLRQLEEWVPAHYQARQRYLELAVFPEDTNIPLSTLQIYWKGTGELREWEVEDLCLRVVDLSLLLPWNPERGTVRLHDVLRGYLIQRVGEQLPALHGQLLDICQQEYGVTRWADLPRRESYLWQHLILHLCEAGLQESLQTTLTDLGYLTRKALYVGIFALETDLLRASTLRTTGVVDPATSLFASLHRSIVRISHQLRQTQTEAEIGGLLLGHLGWEPAFAAQRFSFERDLPRPFLTAWHPLPTGSAAALLRTLLGHTSSVLGCAISPDGCFIVSASGDGTLKLWDTVTGIEQLTLRGHTEGVHDCAVSSDGKWIVSASADKTLKVWDIATGTEQLSLVGHTDEVRNCAVSPDSRLIISASLDKTLKVWDAATGTEQLTLIGHSECVNSCAVSSDGKWIASVSSDKTLKVWDIATGIEHFTLQGTMFFIHDCAISPDGKWIVSASWDGMLKVWDMATPVEAFSSLDHPSFAYTCAISPDGRWMASASFDKTIKIWDTNGGWFGLPHHFWKGHQKPVTSCAISPNGRWMASASADKTIKIWNVTQGRLRFGLRGHKGPVTSCAISPNGKWIASASRDCTIKIWNITTSPKSLTLWGHRKPVTNCAISPDGKWIVSASADKTLKVWEIATAQQRSTLQGHTDGVNDCAVSPDGKWIVSASSDCTLIIWEVATGQQYLTLTGHKSQVQSCAISPDGKWIASASIDQTIKVWSTQTGQCVVTFPVDGLLLKCVFHPDGEHLIACGVQGTYFLRLVV